MEMTTCILLLRMPNPFVFFFIYYLLCNAPSESFFHMNSFMVIFFLLVLVTSSLDAATDGLEAVRKYTNQPVQRLELNQLSTQYSALSTQDFKPMTP